MSAKKKWMVGIIVFVIGGGIAVFGLAAILYRQAFLNAKNLTEYVYQTSPSTHEGYSHQTLTIASSMYVSDYEEYGLSSAGNDILMGETATGQRVYQIAGQADCLVVYDFMSPLGVFRNTLAPPFDWRTVDFNEMRLYPMVAPNTQTPADPITSTDKNLIAEALTPLRDSSIKPLSPDQITLAQTYSLSLYGDQLSGMWYILGVYVDTDGKVYVAENTLSKEWFPASETFAEWIQ